MSTPSAVAPGRRRTGRARAAPRDRRRRRRRGSWLRAYPPCSTPEREPGVCPPAPAARLDLLEQQRLAPLRPDRQQRDAPPRSASSSTLLGPSATVRCGSIESNAPRRADSPGSERRASRSGRRNGAVGSRCQVEHGRKAACLLEARTRTARSPRRGTESGERSPSRRSSPRRGTGRERDVRWDTVGGLGGAGTLAPRVGSPRPPRPGRSAVRRPRPDRARSRATATAWGSTP